MGMRSLLYIAWNRKQYVVNISHDPVMDLAYHAKAWGCWQMWIISPLLLLGQAMGLLWSVSSPLERKGMFYNQKKAPSSVISWARYLKDKASSGASCSSVLKAKFALVQSKLKSTGQDPLDEPQLVVFVEKHLKDTCLETKLEQAKQLLPLVEGRMFCIDELEKILSGDLNLKFPVEDLFQLLYLQKKVDIYPGVGINDKGRPQCFRCGTNNKLRQSYCLDCGSTECYYCETCISMGEVRECKPLYGVPALFSPKSSEVNVELDFQLTEAQKDTALKVWQFTKASGIKKCLVWAACGAGKTEIAFPAMAQALSLGHKVLFAVPRRDTLIDIEQRIKSCFSGVEIAALYGGSEEKYKKADLALATTHQALRFYQGFHLVVLDEVDAFPYYGSYMLYYGLNRAIHPDGKIVYLTATPPDSLLKIPREELERVTIPVRYHGHPLPVPEIIIEKSLQLKGENLTVPDSLLHLLHKSVEGDLAQVLVFVPTIFLAEKTGEALKTAFELPPFNNFDGGWVDYTHSQDPERDKKRERFLKGEFPVLVTTTLLERGINVPKVNVLVLFAENRYIFDTRTLVQMAGRVGRMAENPHGNVWFVGTHATPAMKEAISWIKNMNKEAAEKGYLNRLPAAGRMKLKNAK
ncbi:MAG: DEAD/DEAH box helicase [Bacillota bacterium]